MSPADFRVPRIIYSLWLQGENDAPELVRLIFRRWASLNPSYEVRILDGNDVRRLLENSGISWQAMTPQALSDVVRMQVLADGGVWADASVLPIEPLDAWLPSLLQDSGFFAFEKPGVDRPISSWFLAASRNQILMKKWLEEVERFWSKPRSLATYESDPIPQNPVWEVAPNGGAVKDEFPYFWLHYLFRYLLETDVEFAFQWGRCSKLSAGPPHQLQGLFTGGDRHSIETIVDTARSAPVQKLNWRASYPLDIFETL